MLWVCHQTFMREGGISVKYTCLEQTVAGLWALKASSIYEILQFRAPCHREVDILPLESIAF